MSLMRFKCVCKRWNILIRYPKFAKLHHARSLDRPGGTSLLITLKHPLSELHFMFIDHKGNPIRQHLRAPNFDQFSQVINGLVCLSSHNCVSLLNVYTHEIITLPTSNFELCDGNRSIHHSYLLGFNPLANQYKVLCICTVEELGYVIDYGFEVYTLGSSHEWKKINPPSNYKFSSPFYSHKQCICVNGVIYWIQNSDQDYNQKYLELFDLKDEKFHGIRFQGGVLSGPVNLIQVRGTLAIAHPPKQRSDGGFDIELWILESYRHPVLKKENIIVPGTMGIYRPYPAGFIHRTGEILVMDNILTIPSRFLLYDLCSKKCGDSTTYTHCLLRFHDSQALAGEWSRFSHNVFKKGFDLLKYCISDQVENILPLKSMVTGFSLL
ncbi:FBA_3 domain-containing protein [Cephalotus follicularis]|uniref:FBA_3 domain-containing protein n=1 Tax=Cephalotus follicularis TaxID=3775 RepID=A0A1Q3AS17_CEPFO|nr:FBA_3 domain-containing protein [Cephalotus follicularis]